MWWNSPSVQESSMDTFNHSDFPSRKQLVKDHRIKPLHQDPIGTMSLVAVCVCACSHQQFLTTTVRHIWTFYSGGI